MPNFIKIECIEADEFDDSILTITEKLVRESDIESIERFISDEEGIDGALIKFYDGDYLIIQNSLDDVHEMLEERG